MSRTHPLVRTVAIGALVAVATVAVVGVLATTGVGLTPPVDDEPSADGTQPLVGGAVVTDTVSEEAYAEPVPERGDPYFEAEDPDGDWISYINPRDEYRSPYLGDGSGKICAVLLNEAGDPVVGESVPNTTVTIPTGDSLAWHSAADPIAIEYPLTDHYERPLDADQFGVTPDLPQGDGYLDSHCVEFHGLPEDGTIEYGEAEIGGDHADRIDVVGYIQQAHEAWDTDVDPIEDAVSYEAAGGGWTYQTEESHGQAMVVLQLVPEGDGTDDSDDGEGDDSDGGGDGIGDDRGDDSGDDEDEGSGDGDDSGSTDDEPPTEGESDDVGADDEVADADDGTLPSITDEMPGYGLLVAAGAIAVAVGTRLLWPQE